ncbi:MAG TPA: PilN domain-containing protein [Thermoanaerobaculia bacterium]|jgi:type IV pilus assembly protein PilN
MIKINLLSEGKRPAAVRKVKVPAALRLEGQDIGQWMLGVGLLLGVIALAVSWYYWDRKLEAKTEEVNAAQREVDALAPVIKEVEDYKAKKAELERKIGIINDLKANQRGPVRVMDYISRALPELLWLDRLRMTADTIEIEGRAFNTNAVANFIDNLDKVPEFDEPTLKSTEQQQGGIYKFVIDFNYSFATHAKPAAEGAPGAAPAAGAATSASG